VKLYPGAHVFYAFGFALKYECDNGSLLYLLIQSALGRIWSKSFMLIISLEVMRKS
jgi:hypothetical protein